ncbi:MAG: hypothetical protein P4L46_20860 [Fimbriimonas sp.]|nr:hypothetical protein [Fimbriimonas sp.]
MTNVFPAGIVTDFGTDAEEEPLVIVTTTPSAGAASERVTRPVDAFPLLTVDGLKVSDVIVGGSTVRDADFEAPFSVAARAAFVTFDTDLVRIVKVATVLPAATTTEFCTVTESDPLAKAIGSPVAGAGLEIVTVPPVEALPTTVAGFTVSAESAGGSIVRFADFLVDPTAPLTTTVVEARTGWVATANLAVTLPAATLTAVGTTAEVELLVSWIRLPPLGAGPSVVEMVKTADAEP